jgi:hypothetical protein
VGRLASLSEFRLARDPSELLTIGRHDPLDTAHQAKGDGGQGGEGTASVQQTIAFHNPSIEDVTHEEAHGSLPPADSCTW